jgi:hypothetical protein
MQSTTEDDCEIHVRVLTKDAKHFIATRAILLEVLASLHLAFSAVLWHVVFGTHNPSYSSSRVTSLMFSELTELPDVRTWAQVSGSDVEWDDMVGLSRLVSQLGLVYICFGYIEGSCSRQMGKEPILHSTGVVLVVETALAATWSCESSSLVRRRDLTLSRLEPDIYYKYSYIMIIFARYHEDWLSLAPVIVNIGLCVFWSSSVAHLLVPFVHRLLIKSDGISTLELASRDVEDFPWSDGDEGQVQLKMVEEEPTAAEQEKVWMEKC